MVSKLARTIVYSVLGVAYHVQASDKACKCDNGVADGNTCEAENDIKCTSCNDGYFLAGGHCEVCNVHIPDRDILRDTMKEDYGTLGYKFTRCLKCSAGGKCTEVMAGPYFLADDVVNVCMEGCEGCTVGDKCKADGARRGWYVESEKPTKCATGCIECTEAEKCTDGREASGYRLDADKKPEACGITGCTDCDADKAQCTAAESAHWLDTTADPDEVGPCAENCAQCSKTECTSAKSGYLVKAGEKEVDACAANCWACTVKDKCSPDRAEAGYFVKADETTGQCVEGCETCDQTTTDAQKCLTPMRGYVLDADGKPHKCPTGCDKCHESNTDKTKCNADGLEPGYFLKDDKPAACEAGCGKCTDETECLIPYPTHYRNDDGKIALCGGKCEFCLGKTCIKEKSKDGSGDNVSGSVSNVLSVGVALAVGVAATQL